MLIFFLKVTKKAILIIKYIPSLFLFFIKKKKNYEKSFPAWIAVAMTGILPLYESDYNFVIF